MPLRSKVKTRIWALCGSAFALAFAGLIIANDPAKNASQGLGERAVQAPRPPVIAPPILDKANARNSIIKVNLASQRLILLVDGEVAIDSPVSSGRKDFETPTGRLGVGRRGTREKPGQYGNLVDSAGKVIVRGVYRHRDPVPRGLRCQAVQLDYILSVNDQGFRFHAGAVGGVPVSDGSIILPDEVAKILFVKVATGCPIEIVAE